VRFNNQEKDGGVMDIDGEEDGSDDVEGGA
jgi:hypothetical protein